MQKVSTAVSGIHYRGVGEGKGFLDTNATVFEVERWTDDNIVTKPEKGRCTTRVIDIDLVNRETRSVIVATSGTETCDEQPRALKLQGGAKARADALENAQ